MAKQKARPKKGARPKSQRPWLTWAIVAGLAVTAAVLAFFAFGRGGGDAAPGRVSQTPVVSDDAEVTIDIIDNDFKPRDLTIRPGTKVTWRMEGEAAHTVTQYDGAFDSGQMQPGDSYVMTFADAGTYEYYCVLHHAMQGKLVIAQ